MRPNVIVFFTDQQRWDSTGVHGNPLGLTPHFDRLAQAGTHLVNCFTPQPVCTPARACMQTGRYASSVDCWRNGSRLPEGIPTLAQRFNDAGYRTGYIGKWHLAGKDSPGGKGAVPKDRRGGYQDWLAADSVEATSTPYNARLWDDNDREVILPGYRSDAFTDAAIRYVHQRTGEDQPFFLFLSLLEPHHQNDARDYPPPAGYRTPHEGRWIPSDLAALPTWGFDASSQNRQTLAGSAHRHLGGYWGMIKRIDEALGRLMDALQSLDILDNTIVLFTSDHGCHFNTRNNEYKRSCHESSIRVPGMITGPGFDGGGAIQQLVSLVDLPATLLDAAGIDLPEDMQGRSILPLLRRERDDWPQDVFIQITERRDGRALRTSRWKYEITSITEPAVGGSSAYRETLLYDLQHDPHELYNLIDQPALAQVRSDLRERLLGWIESVEGSKPEVVAFCTNS